MRLTRQRWVEGRLVFVRALARLPIAVLPLVIARTYGASTATDCFFLVYSGVLLATNAVAPLLETAVVPFVAQARAGGKSDAFIAAVVRRVASWLMLVTLALVIAGLAWHWRGAAGGWEDGWRHLIVLAALPPLTAATAALSGYLNAGERFLVAAGAAGVRGVTALILGVALAPILGLVSYSLGIVLAEAVALVWLLGAGAMRVTTLVKPAAVDLSDFWKLFMSLIAGGLANSSKGFVDRFVAGWAGAGAISIIEYAERLFLLAMSIVGAPFATVVLSRWSAAFPHDAKGSPRELIRVVRRAQRLAIPLALCIVVALAAAVWIDPLRRAVLGRFSAMDAGVVQWALAMYLLGAVPYLLGLVTTQAILILRDARFVAAVAIAIAVVNVPMDIVALGALGLPGIALTSSILHTIGWIAAEVRLRSRAMASAGMVPRTT